MPIDKERLRALNTQEIEKRIQKMDDNLLHIEDQRMQLKSMETITALRAELDRRRRGVR
mgnify:CR=1 FL=1